MDNLDREMQAMLAVEPSSQFVARVRTAVSAQPVTPRFSLRLITLAATALLALGGGIMVTRLDRATHPDAEAAITSVAGHHVVLHPASDPPPVSDPQVPKVRNDTSGMTIRRGAVHPPFDVMISDRDKQAYQLLFRSVISGNRSWTVTGTSQADPAGYTATNIEIPPIVIQPLRPLDGDEGVFQ